MSTTPQLPSLTASFVVPGLLTTHPDVIQRTDEWYQLRCGLITASTVGQLITARHQSAIEYACPECDATPGEPCRSKRGGGPTKTVHSERTAHATENRASSPLIIEASIGDEGRGMVSTTAAERITGRVDPTGMSYDMARGVDDEPFAVAAYAEHHAPVVECGFMVRSWGPHQLGYSPDGLVGDDGLIEIKSRRGRGQVDTVLSGHVPAANVAQCQAALFVSGRKWLDYVSYAEGMALWTVRVHPDPKWFAAITAAVAAFETAVTATVDRYTEAVKGLPVTPRSPMDMVI